MSDLEWFYQHEGKKLGPVTDEQLVQLHLENKISDDTLVWRKGFQEWLSIAKSGLVAPPIDTPGRSPAPPIEADKKEAQSQPKTAKPFNLWVWVVAFLPLILLPFSWNLSEQDALGIGLLVPLAAYALFIWLDERALKNAGYVIKGGLFWLLLVPVYLFVRAKRTKQIPLYGIVWLVCFVISMFLSLGGSASFNSDQSAAYVACKQKILSSFSNRDFSRIEVPDLWSVRTVESQGGYTFFGSIGAYIDQLSTSTPVTNIGFMCLAKKAGSGWVAEYTVQ